MTPRTSETLAPHEPAPSPPAVPPAPAPITPQDLVPHLRGLSASLRAQAADRRSC
ncbi:hypothetical protein ACFWF4_22230 [Nocardiopsis flavescens]|uniref:hypothetical protein n=1 Tax=Nocardiopsis flavescens TaxID=758803 RepID=UPI0015B7AF4C|nr:hypothetical protein [Nocardiopsis flavescens]